MHTYFNLYTVYLRTTSSILIWILTAMLSLAQTHFPSRTIPIANKELRRKENLHHSLHQPPPTKKLRPSHSALAYHWQTHPISFHIPLPCPHNQYLLLHISFSIRPSTIHIHPSNPMPSCVEPLLNAFSSADPAKPTAADVIVEGLRPRTQTAMVGLRC